MMKNIYFLILLFPALAFAQKHDAWVIKEAEKDPMAFIQKTAKEIPASPIEKAGKLFAIGRCYEYLNQEDIALKYYLISKKEFEKLKLTSSAKDIALDIHKVISSQENYNKYGRLFLDEYYTYAKKTAAPERLSRSWNEFGKIAYDKFWETENVKYLDSSIALYNKALNYAYKTSSRELKSQIYNNLATDYSQLEKFPAARYYLKKSSELISQKDDYELFSNYYNYGITYFYESNYAEALLWFRKAEKYEVPKYKEKNKRLFYKKLKETYDALNDHPNRRKYDSLFYFLDQKIKDENQNIAIHDINVKYQVAEKNRKISALEQFKEKFHKNRVVFSILLFLVFMLALYSFVRWKKIDYRKKKLEIEKQIVQLEKIEIEEELEKVKKIVTEGYIILKDKTKVYLNDLMYVKADDHYLNAVTQDGKRHFVRGKLKQILSELPPNFVQCQRSYIVNINFIKSVNQGFITLKNNTEIPVSRSFKL
jgi:tetratricopeptide (TPR) repeat protein